MDRILEEREPANTEESEGEDGIGGELDEGEEEEVEEDDYMETEEPPNTSESANEVEVKIHN